MKKSFTQSMLILCLGIVVGACNIPAESNSPQDLFQTNSYLKSIPNQDDLNLDLPNLQNPNFAAGGFGQGVDPGNIDVSSIGFRLANRVNDMALRHITLMESLLDPAARMEITEETGVVGEFEYNGKAIFGPHQAPMSEVEFRLSIYRGIDPNDQLTTYVFLLEARPMGSGDDAYVVVISGGSKPGADGSGYFSGMIQLDLDALAATGHQDFGEGTITFVYEKTESYHVAAAELSAVWDGFRDEPVVQQGTLFYAQFGEIPSNPGDDDHDGEEDDADDEYADDVLLSANGARVSSDAYAVIDFNASIDIPLDQGHLLESLHVVDGWTQEGSGRADATAESGDLVEGSAELTLCWDEAEGTYVHLDGESLKLPVMGLPIDFGDKEACFTDQPVQVPDFDWQAIKARYEALVKKVTG